MKKIGILLFLASLCLLLVTACGADTPDQAVEDTTAVEETAVGEAVIAEATIEETAPAATNTMPPPTETAVPPTVTVEPTATEEVETAAEEEALPTPTVEPTLEPNPDVLESNCLNCHSDQQLLMDLASPEEEPEESESSGVG